MGNWTVVKCSCGCGRDAMVSMSELETVGQGIHSDCISIEGRLRRINAIESAMKFRPSRRVQFIRNKIGAGFYELKTVQDEIVEKIIKKDGFIVA